MHVVIATRIFAPEPGAASLRLSALADGLARRGHAVTVITTRAPLHGRPETLPAVEIRRWPVLRDAAGTVRGYLPYLSFDVPLVLRLLAVRRPDVVMAEPPPTTGLAALLAAALLRIPYVYYAGDVLADAAAAASAPSAIVAILRRLERLVWRSARLVLSVSSGVANRMAELGVSNNVVTVGAGVEVRRFGVAGARHSIGRPYFLYAGTASEVHGATIFVEAFRHVLASRPDAALVFAGNGSDWVELQSLASSLPEGAVLLVPRMSTEAIASWFRGAVAALASVRPGAGYDFAFPTKLYAATASGTPVIFAGIGPGADFVSAATVDVGSAVAFEAEAIAAAMLARLEAPARADERAEIARWAAEAVSVAASVTSAVEALEKATRR